MYSRARAYTCYARGTIGGRKKKKNTSIHATRISPSLRVRGRNEASNVRAMRPDNRRKRNGGTGEGGKRGRNTGCVIPRHRVFIVSRGRVQWASCSLLINAHSFLSFFLSLSLDFNFFFFYSARHEEEYIILAYITACAKETAKLSRRENIPSSRGRDPESHGLYFDERV